MVSTNRKPLVLGLGFSPRKGGNSDQLLRWALEGARKAGAEAKALHVRDFRLKPCTNCSECDEDGICVLKDDFSKLSKKIDAADMLVIASPVYFLGVPSHGKALIDRFQSYWVRKFLLDKPPERDNRPALLLLVAGSDKKDVFECSKRSINAFLRVAGFRLHHEKFFGGVDEKGSAKFVLGVRTQAESAGKALALGRN
jgi:multimeric flavodoxin WrbA